MSNNKTLFFKQIQAMSPLEWKKCSKFIMHNTKKKDIQNFIMLLKKTYPNIKVNKTSIFSIIYPNQPYNDHTYRNLVYQSFMLLKEYIKISEKKEDILNHMLYVKKLKTPNNSITYYKELRKINSSENILQDYFVSYEMMESQDTIIDRQADRNLQDISNKLDQHYIHEKLKITCSLINEMNIKNTNIKHGILDSFEDKLQNIILDKSSYTYLLYQCYLFLRYNIDHAFTSILHLLESKENKYKNCDDLSMILSFCVNYSVKQINTGNSEYYSLLFQIYKLQLYYKTIYDKDGFISAVSMRNILRVSLIVKNYSWTEEFIISNKHKLPLKHREENYHFLLARLYYSKKEYHTALKYLQLSNPEDFFNNLSYRVLQIKCCIKLDALTQADNYIENFRLFLLRHKNKSYHHTFYSHFIKYMKQIINITPTKSAKKILRDKLQNENQVAEKSWLLSLLK